MAVTELEEALVTKSLLVPSVLLELAKTIVSPGFKSLIFTSLVFTNTYFSSKPMLVFVT